MTPCFSCLLFGVVRNHLLYICLDCKPCFVDPICIPSVWGCRIFKFWNTAAQVIRSRPGVHLSSRNKAHMDFLSHHIMSRYCSFNAIGGLMVWWGIFCSDSCKSLQADSGSKEHTLFKVSAAFCQVLRGIGVMSSLHCSFEICTVPQGRNHQLTTGNIWYSSRRRSKQEVDGQRR